MVDLERIYLDCAKTKAAQARIDAEVAAARQVLLPLRGELEYVAGQMDSPLAAPAEIEDLRRRAAGLRARLEDLEKTFPPTQISAEEKHEILGGLSRLIGEFAASRGYSVVLDQGATGSFGQPITHSLGNFTDLTEMVLSHLQAP